MNGNRLIVLNELYASKTCGKCGHINEFLGGSRIFKCPERNLKIDRDKTVQEIYLSIY